MLKKSKALLALLLIVCILGTSCSSLPLKTQEFLWGVGGSAAVVGLSILPIFLSKTDTEKAQAAMEKYTKEINEADTLDKIQNTILKANKTAQKNKQFEISDLKVAVDKRCKEINVPFILSDNKITYDIHGKLNAVKEIGEIHPIIQEAKKYNVEEFAYLEINKYFKQNYIPYQVTDKGDIQLASNIEQILETIYKKAITNSDITILLDWLVKYDKELGQYYNTPEETIRTTIESCITVIIKQSIPDKVEEIRNKVMEIEYTNYSTFIYQYLNMTQNDCIEYVNDLINSYIDEYIKEQELIKEEEIYNQAIEEEDPIIYTSQYPNGNFDSSKIPTSPMVLEYREALTSYEKAKEFVEDFPNSKYTSKVYEYIHEIEVEIWKSSKNYQYLTLWIPKVVIDNPISELDKTLREYIEKPSFLINENSDINYDKQSRTLKITGNGVTCVFKIRTNINLIDYIIVDEEKYKLESYNMTFIEVLLSASKTEIEIASNSISTFWGSDEWKEIILSEMNLKKY